MQKKILGKILKVRAFISGGRSGCRLELNYIFPTFMGAEEMGAEERTQGEGVWK